MNWPRSKSLLLALVFASVSVASARAGSATGDPYTDGWDFNGNSLDLGTFVYANSTNYNNLFNFDVYSSSFSLEAGSNLIGNGWQAGDMILGIGAMVNSGPLNDKVRILAKFGASDTTFQASSFAPGNPIPVRPPNTLYGDGIGSSSTSGTGGVVIETPQIWTTNPATTPWFNTTDAGAVVLTNGTKMPDSTGKAANVTRFDGGNGTNINSFDVGKMIYQLNSQALLSSFETYLNISQLERAGFDVNPVGDKFVLAIQRQADDFTKATGQFSAVPEPSSLVLAGFSLGGLGLMYLRRRP